MLTRELTLTRQATTAIERASTQYWASAAQEDERILYSLACAYAVAHEVGAEVPNAIGKARLYLAYSLGRDLERDLWKWVGRDRNLASIGDEFVKRLKLGLMRKRLTTPGLPKMKADNFRAAINDVFEATSASEG